MIILSPWAFGTTQSATILVMNITGYTLGMLLSLKWFIRGFKGYRPWRWSGNPTPTLTGLTRALAALTVVILAYCCISALNARASWRPESASFEYYPVIAWLPQSYARQMTWRAFGNFLALACVFWAVRDWLQGTSEAEERSLRKNAPLPAAEQAGGAASPREIAPPVARRRAARVISQGEGEPAFLPARLRCLLWVLCINGALLAVESIAQRFSGTGKLLWLVEPRINKEAIAQLGPYAYRSNGAQYFNLVWPVCLGFWWTLRRELRHRRADVPAPRRRLRAGAPHALLAGALLMAACPILSASRAGAVVSFAAMLVASAILLFGRRRRHRAVKFGLLAPWGARQAGVALFFGTTLATAIYFGRGQLGERFKTLGEGYAQREAMFDTARKIPRDFPMFGTGPGTFEAVFQLYRSSTDEYWPVQLHNDWLETLITFGWVGSLLIALAFGCALGLSVLSLKSRVQSRGLQTQDSGLGTFDWRMTSLLWLALAGCLLHARFDFPFQIYSLLLLFLLECAILSVVTRSPSGAPRLSSKF